MKPTSAKAAASKTPSCGGLVRQGEDQQLVHAMNTAMRRMGLTNRLRCLCLVANTRNRIVHSGQTLICGERSVEVRDQTTRCRIVNKPLPGMVLIAEIWSFGHSTRAYRARLTLQPIHNLWSASID